MLLNFPHSSVRVRGWELVSGGSTEDMVKQYLLLRFFMISIGVSGKVRSNAHGCGKRGCYRLLGRFKISVPYSEFRYVVLCIIRRK
jgi:hypothetical protein